MSKVIQVRGVPNAVHRRLRARAAKAGVSLSDYLLSELKQRLEQPTLAQSDERVRQRGSVRRGD